MVIEEVLKEEKEIVFIYTTCATFDEARNIGFMAINKKLCACVDFWPISSIYPWQGVIEEVGQFFLILATQKIKADELIKFVESIHSYNIPFISKMDSNFTTLLYKSWIDRTLHDQSKYITNYEKKIINKKYQNKIERLK